MEVAAGQGRGASRCAFAVLGLALAIVSGCGGDARPRGRVLLVGIDGATLRIAQPLLEAGRLPHLEALARAGIYAPLRAHYPISSPRIWTSMATGKRPEKHGILDFARTVDGEQQLYLGSDRKGAALWNIASEAGLRVGVINWWNTYPVEIVEGVIVSDHLLSMDVEGRRRMTGADTPTRGTIAWPEAWSARAAALLADDSPLTDVADPFARRDDFPGWVRPERLSLRYENDADVVRIALAVERELSPELMMVFLPGIDRVSHVVWAAVASPKSYKAPPAFTAAQRKATRAALQGYYVYTDALIGRLMESYADDDLVMVVSDHGFEAGAGLGFLTGVHESARAVDGLLFARGRGVGTPAQSGGRISVNDVAPTVLAWLGLPTARDMDGHAASFLVGVDAVEPVDSYDALPIRRLASTPSGAEEEILEQLHALGYFEGDGDAP